MSIMLINAAAPTVLILLIILLRQLFGGKIPRKFFYILWTAAALRLIMPFSLCGTLLLRLPLLPSQAPDGPRTVTESSGNLGEPGKLGKLSAAEFSEQFSGKAEIFTAVYVGGAILLALYFCIGHIKTLYRCKFSLPSDIDASGLKSSLGLRRKVDIRICENALSPFTYGIFSRVIILPRGAEETREESLRHILGHELIHIKRLDVLRNMLFAAALCINWINPAMWLMFFLAHRDMELTCDEEAVERFAFSPKEYALTLISMEERLPRSFSAAFGKKPVGERIERIISDPPSMGAAAGAAAVMISAAFFTAAERMPYSADISENADNTVVEEYAVYTDNAAEITAVSEELSDYAASGEIAVAAAEISDTLSVLKDVTFSDAVSFFGIEIYDITEDTAAKRLSEDDASVTYAVPGTGLSESRPAEYTYAVAVAVDYDDFIGNNGGDAYYADEYLKVVRAE